ncbi:hypothetical protein C9374_000453 [Naegleria lovaniensis]|uniref:Uncharacterized protein n=1 Tax=Naegleria lovaniensis TaxID=51637 RepID=A0AA88GYD1_NAELO|nr:uncharacterized protein C9374_000453 [Naegleria lovaniensis]KAG2388289.1 hypothetical protein C9374_000453 [Naegleria lovaniensis]
MNHSISQNVLYDDEFLPSDDPFLFGDEKEISFEDSATNNMINNNNTLAPASSCASSTTSSEESTSTVCATNDNKKSSTATTASGLVVLLKQAKGREDQFEDRFPPSLLCHPYKYDLKIIGSGIENHRQHKLTLNLVDAETLIVPNVTLPNNKKIVEAVAVEQVEELNPNERMIRFTFNLCSFHFKRRSFRLELTQTVDGTVKRLFLSDPFQTFARRREHHQSLGSSKASENIKNNLATQTSPSLSNAPLTPDSSNSGSNSILSSPKSEKQGVKRSIASVNSSYYPMSKSRTMMQEPSSPTILNPSAAVPHYTTAPGAFGPYMFPANYAAVAAAYHQEMAQQFASLPIPYAAAKMPMYYQPQWTTAYQPQFVFGSPQTATSPISPPSNVIMHQEKTPDVLSALFDTVDKNKTKKEKQIHHTPLNFIQQPQPEPTSERASLAIQLLKSLTPTERQTVNMFINNSSSNV